MTLNVINKVLKGIAIAAVALTSTVFQAGGCTINVTGVDQMLDGLVSGLGTTDCLGETESIDPEFTFSDSSSSNTCSWSPTPSYYYTPSPSYWGGWY